MSQNGAKVFVGFQASEILSLGPRLVTDTQAVREVGRSPMEFAPLPMALSIGKPGLYWIAAEGAPTDSGYYKVDEDNTLTKLKSREEWLEIPWEMRLYVSLGGASAAFNANAPLALEIHQKGSGNDGRVGLFNEHFPDNLGQIILLLKGEGAQNGTSDMQVMVSGITVGGAQNLASTLRSAAHQMPQSPFAHAMRNAAQVLDTAQPKI